MMYKLPSYNLSEISIPTKLLEVVWTDMFETDNVNPDVARQHQADFLKGAPPQWLNFYPDNLALVERDGFNDLIQLIEKRKEKCCLITEVSLRYQSGSGGSTLAMQVLWHFRKDLRCARVIDSDLDTKKLSKQVVDLFLMSSEQHQPNRRTVLLLLDTKEKINNQSVKKILWEDLIKEIHVREINTETPAVIILNCKSAVRAPGDVKLKMELLPEEKERFAQKNLEIKKKYKKMSQKLHAFNIMQGGFQKEYAEKVITEEMVKHVKNHKDSSSSRLLSFLALTNSYVPGSHLSKPLCKKFIVQTEWEKPSLQMIMKPFEDLMVTFSEGEQKGICLAHPMIADACLKMLTEHNVTISNIAHDFMNKMVQGKESNYDKICKSMLVTRTKGLIGKEKFSILIHDILDERENNTRQCICLLELASDWFSTDPFYPQTLARLYYIEVKGENKYVQAEKWAKVAIKRDNKNSHIRDTLGQVHKNHLSWIWNQRRDKWSKVGKPCTDIKTRLIIAQDAIEAFEAEEKAAEDELANPNTKYNNRGRFGFLQVCKEIYDLIPKHPVEQKHLDFISGLRSSVEEKYDFFEWYLAFSKPSFKKKEPDYFHRDVEDCYNQYFSQTEEKPLNEKKKKSFGGLLDFLKSDINVCKPNLGAIEKPQSENEDQIVLYILANIILSQAGEPCEKTERLQARLQRLWFSRERGRSPEFYLLILLLFWPDEAQKTKANPPDLENCVQYMSQSYENGMYGKYLRGRYLVPLFFLGKDKGLQKLVHALKPHTNGLERLVQPKLHQSDPELLTEEDESVEVECLQRINGKVRNHKVFAVADGHQIQVTPQDRASVCKQGQVSFYLGFNIRGPVAYNIRYTKNCK